MEKIFVETKIRKNNVFRFSENIFLLKFHFPKGIILSAVRDLDDDFLLRYESRSNDLSLGYLVVGLPSATSSVTRIAMNDC